MSKTIKKLTKEQREDYVNNGGNTCPFCESYDIL